MLAGLITLYGYPALVLGLFIEGEAVLAIAGFLAHQGYLSLCLVFLIGWLGTLASDQFFYWLGRTRGQQFLANKPHWHYQIERVDSLLKNHKNLLLAGFRFMYGFRIVAPIYIGATKVSPRKFLPINIINTAVWATVYAGGGYLFGNTLGLFFKNLRHLEIRIIASIILVMLLVWLAKIIHYFWFE